MAFSNELTSLAKKELKLIQDQIAAKVEKMNEIRRISDEKIAELEEELVDLERELARLEFVITGKVPVAASSPGPGRPKGSGRKKTAAAAMEYTGRWKAEIVDGKPSILFETSGGTWTARSGKRSKEMQAALAKL